MVMNSSKTDVSDGGANLSPKRRRVGLLYDHRMCKHFDAYPHPENPNRILSIWDKLQSSGINQRCILLNAKEAEDKTIALVHTKKHIDRIKSISSPKFDLRRNRIAASFNSIYFNEGSSEAAYLAAGSVVEVAEKVAKGELDSAFAIVRPPGHHAETNEPMGFCLYNNVAIAASYLLNERTELGINKILIVDWDVHHGNGTQKMFWKDSRVLFFSVHRHEFGSFYPGGDDGSYEMIGEGPGAGYNINVPWENHSCGDADYLAVWDHVLIPVAKAFDPGIIIISAGFDAAIDDPLGGCCVSPYGYSIMLSKLMEFAGGKIVMALEGGYNLASLANSALACVEVLLDHKPVAGSLGVDPLESTWRVIQMVREQLSSFWPTLRMKLPEDLTHKRRSPVLVASPDSDGEFDNGPHSISEDLATTLEQVIQPLHNLKVEDGQVPRMTAMHSAKVAPAPVDTTATPPRVSKVVGVYKDQAPRPPSKRKATNQPTEALQIPQKKPNSIVIPSETTTFNSEYVGLEVVEIPPLDLSVDKLTNDMMSTLDEISKRIAALMKKNEELEKCKETVAEIEKKCQEAVADKKIFEKKCQKAMSEKEVLEKKYRESVSEKETLEKKCRDTVAEKEAFEKKYRDLLVENTKLKGEMLTMKVHGGSQGSTFKAVVRKLMQTVDFSSWCGKLTTGAIDWGKNMVLRQLMNVCPQLLLKKRVLGWDPYCDQRIDALQQRVQKEMPSFKFLDELEKGEKVWTAEKVATLEIDYDKDLDEVYEEVPAEWICEHDGSPYIADTNASEPLVDKCVS